MHWHVRIIQGGSHSEGKNGTPNDASLIVCVLVFKCLKLKWIEDMQRSSSIWGKRRPSIILIILLILEK